MDADSFGLLHSVVEGHALRLRAVIDSSPKSQRGSTYLDFVELHLAAIEGLSTSTAASFAGADASARVVYGRKMMRAKQLLEILHNELFSYRLDVGRRDLQSGLLYLVDLLIEDLLKASADPVIHLDASYMYSTQRLLGRWEALSSELGVAWTQPTEPIIFNLPGLEPTNALLSPVLAHEVGHSVIQKNDLVNALGTALDPAPLDHLVKKYEADDAGADPADAFRQFAAWAEELLCDALATELTGPSFAFSVAVFFPASSAGLSGPEHPDPAQRFDLALKQISMNGWRPALDRLCPDVMSWLDAVALTPPTLVVTPREEFLRGLVELAIPEIITIAHHYVDTPLEWGDYEPHEGQLATFLQAGIPPAEFSGQSADPWHIIAAVWLHGMLVHGATASGLVSTVRDKDLSRFALKSIEMSRVLRLWRDGDAATS